MRINGQGRGAVNKEVRDQQVENTPRYIATLAGMTTGPTLPERPQLRPIEVSDITREGNDYFVLKAPRHLAEQTLLVPAPLGLYLENMDGTNTVEELVGVAVGNGAQQLPMEILADLVGRLDEVLLLTNGAYTAEIARRLS